MVRSQLVDVEVHRRPQSQHRSAMGHQRETHSSWWGFPEGGVGVKGPGNLKFNGHQRPRGGRIQERMILTKELELILPLSEFSWCNHICFCEIWTYEVPKPQISTCHLLHAWPKPGLHIQPAWAWAPLFWKGECSGLHMAVPSWPNSWFPHIPSFCQLPPMAGTSTQCYCRDQLIGLHWLSAGNTNKFRTGLIRSWTLQWAAKNSNTNSQLFRGPEGHRLRNSVWSWVVVVWQLSEECKGAGVQLMAGSTPFIVLDPMEWSGVALHISWRKRGKTWKDHAGEHPFHFPTTDTALKVMS